MEALTADLERVERVFSSLNLFFIDEEHNTTAFQTLPTDLVGSTARKVLHPGSGVTVEVIFGGEHVDEFSSWAENGVEDGARLACRVVPELFDLHWAADRTHPDNLVASADSVLEAAAEADPAAAAGDPNDPDAWCRGMSDAEKREKSWIRWRAKRQGKDPDLALQHVHADERKPHRTFYPAPRKHSDDVAFWELWMPWTSQHDQSMAPEWKVVRNGRLKNVKVMTRVRGDGLNDDTLYLTGLKADERKHEVRRSFH